MKITYIKTWLFQVAINRHRDLSRRQKRSEEIPIESVQLIGSKGLDEPLLRKELQVEIQSMLGKMNPIYKYILLLKYNYELLYKEIATILEMKEENVSCAWYIQKIADIISITKENIRKILSQSKENASIKMDSTPIPSTLHSMWKSSQIGHNLWSNSQ